MLGCQLANKNILNMVIHVILLLRPFFNISFVYNRQLYRMTSKAYDKLYVMFCSIYIG